MVTLVTETGFSLFMSAKVALSIPVLMLVVGLVYAAQ